MQCERHPLLNLPFCGWIDQQDVESWTHSLKLHTHWKESSMLLKIMLKFKGQTADQLNYNIVLFLSCFFQQFSSIFFHLMPCMDEVYKRNIHSKVQMLTDSHFNKLKNLNPVPLRIFWFRFRNWWFLHFWYKKNGLFFANGGGCREINRWVLKPEFGNTVWLWQ